MIERHLHNTMDRFLVTEPSDMKERGWAELDFVLISGDAYVDHPSFAPAVIGRYLESKGYRVGIYRSTRLE